MPRVVASQAIHRHSPAMLIFKVDLGELLPVGVADAKAFGPLAMTVSNCSTFL